MLLSTIMLNHEERYQTLRLPDMWLVCPVIFTPLKSVLLRTPIYKDPLRDALFEMGAICACRHCACLAFLWTPEVPLGHFLGFQGLLRNFYLNASS